MTCSNVLVVSRKPDKRSCHSSAQLSAQDENSLPYLNEFFCFVKARRVAVSGWRGMRDFVVFTRAAVHSLFASSFSTIPETRFGPDRPANPVVSKKFVAHQDRPHLAFFQGVVPFYQMTDPQVFEKIDGLFSRALQCATSEDSCYGCRGA